MGKTAIGWTDETWNPVRGCSRVSEGCRHCYAEAQAARIVRMGNGKPTAYDGLVKLVSGEPRWTGIVRLVPDHLADPLRWRTPRRVFVNSMSDLFHESLTNEQIAAVFGVMAAAPRHTFQVLTKRADRMRAWFEWAGRLSLDDLQRIAIRAILGPGRCRVTRGTTWPLDNVWMGVSVEDRDALHRLDDLRAIPAAVRMISAEPLLEDLGDIAGHLTRTECPECGLGVRVDEDGCCMSCGVDAVHYGIDWVIDGCESGPGARPAQHEWFASLEEQCRAAGVAYFHKQEMIDGKLVHDFPGRQEFPR